MLHLDYTLEMIAIVLVYEVNVNDHPFSYSAEEDALILEKVHQNGAQASTWNELARLTNRYRPIVILTRHQSLTFGTGSQKLWTLQENEIVLEHFFTGKGTDSLKVIHNFTVSDCQPFASQLKR